MAEGDHVPVAGIQGLRVLITGGAQGVGERIAGDVVAAGGSVAIGDIQEERCRRVAGGLGSSASAHALDVTDADSWSAYVDQASDAMGGIDALVNNAAILHLGPLAGMDPGHIDALIRVNLVGPILGIRAVAPRLSDTGGGSIVNISSVAGLEGRNATVAYTASKWGVRGMTKAAAVEYGQGGVRINAVCPSMGNPEMFAPFLEDFDIERFMTGTPVPKLHSDGAAVETEMQDVSAMVCWLLSPAARRCTGADFVVDAGWTAGTFAPGMPGF